MAYTYVPQKFVSGGNLAGDKTAVSEASATEKAAVPTSGTEVTTTTAAPAAPAVAAPVAVQEPVGSGDPIKPVFKKPTGNQTKFDAFVAPSVAVINRALYGKEKLADIDQNLNAGYIDSDAVSDIDSRYALHVKKNMSAPTMVPRVTTKVDINIEAMQKNIAEKENLTAEDRVRYGRALEIFDHIKASGFNVLRGPGGEYWIESTENGKKVHAVNGIMEVAELIDDFNDVPAPGETAPVQEEEKITPVIPGKKQPIKRVSKVLAKVPEPDPSTKFYLAALGTDVLSTVAGLGIKATTGVTGVGYGVGAATSLIGGLASAGMDAYGDYLNKDVSAWEMTKNLGMRVGMEAFESGTSIPLGMVHKFSIASRSGKALRAALKLYMLSNVIDTATGTEWTNLANRIGNGEGTLEDFRSAATMFQFFAAGTGSAMARNRAKANVAKATPAAATNKETFSKGKIKTEAELKAGDPGFSAAEARRVGNKAKIEQKLAAKKTDIETAKKIDTKNKLDEVRNNKGAMETAEALHIQKTNAAALAKKRALSREISTLNKQKAATVAAAKADAMTPSAVPGPYSGKPKRTPEQIEAIFDRKKKSLTDRRNAVDEQVKIDLVANSPRKKFIAESKESMDKIRTKTKADLEEVEARRKSSAEAIDKRGAEFETKRTNKLVENNKTEVDKAFKTQVDGGKKALKLEKKRSMAEHGSMATNRLIKKGRKESGVSKKDLKALKSTTKAPSTKTTVKLSPKDKVTMLQKKKVILEKQVAAAKTAKKQAEAAATTPANGAAPAPAIQEVETYRTKKQELEKLDKKLKDATDKTKGFVNGVKNRLASAKESTKKGYTGGKKLISKGASATNMITRTAASGDGVNNASLARAAWRSKDGDDLTGNRFKQYTREEAKTELQSYGYELADLEQYNQTQLNKALRQVRRDNKNKLVPKKMHGGNFVSPISSRTYLNIGKVLKAQVGLKTDEPTISKEEAKAKVEAVTSNMSPEAKAAVVVKFDNIDSSKGIPPVVFDNLLTDGVAAAERIEKENAKSVAEKEAVNKKYADILAGAKKYETPKINNLWRAVGLLGDLRPSDFRKPQYFENTFALNPMTAPVLHSQGVTNIPGFEKAINETNLAPRADTSDIVGQLQFKLAAHKNALQNRSQLVARNAEYIDSQKEKEVGITNANISAQNTADNANAQMFNTNNAALAEQRTKGRVALEEQKAKRAGVIENALARGLVNDQKAQRKNAFDTSYADKVNAFNKYNTEFLPLVMEANAKGNFDKANMYKGKFVEQYKYDPDTLGRDIQLEKADYARTMSQFGTVNI